MEILPFSGDGFVSDADFKKRHDVLKFFRLSMSQIRREVSKLLVRNEESCV
jgi:hypothetical protein